MGRSRTTRPGPAGEPAPLSTPPRAPPRAPRLPRGGLAPDAVWAPALSSFPRLGSGPSRSCHSAATRFVLWSSLAKVACVFTTRFILVPPALFLGIKNAMEAPPQLEIRKLRIREGWAAILLFGLGQEKLSTPSEQGQGPPSHLGPGSISRSWSPSTRQLAM
ncbi:hypothetical protein CapIbe_002750, partial [Capra ibex]